MQLDFLARLIGGKAPGIRQPAPAKPREILGDADLTAPAQGLLQAIGCSGLAEKVVIRWNARMRSTAGMAFPQRALVTLNPRLSQFGADEVDRTLRHELAHLVAHSRAGRRRIAPHGEEWRKACTDLGLTDEKRCHTLPLPQRRLQRKHRYRCPSCGIELQRVKPIRRRTACLLCCRKHSRGRYDERFRFVKATP